MQQKVWNPSGSAWGIIAGGSWTNDNDLSTDVPVPPDTGQSQYTTKYELRILCAKHNATPSCTTYAMSDSNEHYVTCPNTSCQEGGKYWNCFGVPSNHALLATCSSCGATSVYACSEHPENCTGSGSPNNGGGQNNNGGGAPSPNGGQNNNGGGGVGQDTNQNVDPGNGGMPVANGGCNTPPANGGCTTTPTLVDCHRRGTAGGYERCYTKVSNTYEHQVNCPGCYDAYWTCNSSDVAEHGLRSCTRPVQLPWGTPCDNQWRRCAYDPYPVNGGTEIINAAPRCKTSTTYLECSGPVLP